MGGRYLSRGKRGPKGGDGGWEEEGEWNLLGPSRYPLPGLITIWVPKTPLPAQSSIQCLGAGREFDLSPTLWARSLKPERGSDFLKVTQQNSGQLGPKPRCRASDGHRPQNLTANSSALAEGRSVEQGLGSWS